MIGPLRRLARNHLPPSLRRLIARVRRRVIDRLSGIDARFARRPAIPPPSAPTILELEQPIRDTGLFEGKRHNIALGAARIDGIGIAPGEVFSFWRAIGAPTARAGFRIGRSIRGDMVAAEIGGGLCQVSGIVYQLLLRAGFEIVERHPHSRDLYSEAERFAPLGLDATVVWPYRDLRLGNPHPVPVFLRCTVDGGVLRASLQGETSLTPAGIEIVRVDGPNWREVRVSRNGHRVSDDRYRFDPVHPAGGSTSDGFAPSGAG
jgi:vancomycin resistance protein VanW